MLIRWTAWFPALLGLLLASFHATAQLAPPGEPIGGWFSSNGVDRGRYGCEGTGYAPCDMDAPGFPVSGLSGGFIKDIVNSQLNACCRQWKPGDTVTVCNGSKCTTYKYTASGNWFSERNFADDGGRYRDKATIKRWWSEEQYSPQCSITGSVSGHYEWNDYYSDGNYVGSGDLQWVVTGISLNRNCV